MNGWQRFGLLILGCVGVMILFPNFDSRGWHFILFTLLGGAAALLLLSVLSNLFAIYRFETLNKIITLVVLGIIVYVLLWYFPQTDYRAPITKLKAGEMPTKADIQRGLKRLTFNFDFVHRNVRRDENFSNQEIPSQPAEKKIVIPAKPVQTQDSIEIIPE